LGSHEDQTGRQADASSQRVRGPGGKSRGMGKGGQGEGEEIREALKRRPRGTDGREARLARQQERKRVCRAEGEENESEEG